MFVGLGAWLPLMRADDAPFDVGREAPSDDLAGDAGEVAGAMAAGPAELSGQARVGASDACASTDEESHGSWRAIDAQRPRDAAFSRIVHPAALGADSPRVAEAHRRAAILAFAETLDGGWPSRALAIAAAMRPGGPLADHGPAPDRMTLTRWHAKWTAHGCNWAALVPLPSTGRRRADLHGDVEAHLLRALRTKPALLAKNPKRLHAAAETFCADPARRGRVRCPSYHAVRRWLRALPPEEIWMAGFGTKAARARTAPASVQPLERPNELWFVDEVLLPTWIRLWNHPARLWEPARVWGIFVLDGYTRACLTFHLTRPLSTNKNTRLSSTATGEQIAGVVAGAIVPELAHPEFRHFARSEPGEIRFDGSGNTKSARNLLAKAARLNTTLGEPYAPWARAAIERYFRTLKERELGLAEGGVLGHAKYTVPFDPTATDPRTHRDRNNFDANRLEDYPWRQQFPVLSLPTFEDLEGIVLHAVKRYNETPHEGLRRQEQEQDVSPTSLWAKAEPPLQAEPYNVLSAFAGAARKIDKRGVTANDHWYLNDALHLVYPVGSKVFVRIDPLARGVWVYHPQVAIASRSTGLFVERRDAFAAAMTPEELVVATRKRYRALRDQQREDQRKVLAEQVGEEAARDLAAQEAERKRKQDRRSGRQKRAAEHERKKSQMSFAADLVHADAPTDETAVAKRRRRLEAIAMEAARPTAGGSGATIASASVDDTSTWSGAGSMSAVDSSTRASAHAPVRIGDEIAMTGSSGGAERSDAHSADGMSAARRAAVELPGDASAAANAAAHAPQPTSSDSSGVHRYTAASLGAALPSTATPAPATPTPATPTVPPGAPGPYAHLSKPIDFATLLRRAQRPGAGGTRGPRPLQQPMQTRVLALPPRPSAPVDDPARVFGGATGDAAIQRGGAASTPDGAAADTAGPSDQAAKAG